MVNRIGNAILYKWLNNCFDIFWISEIRIESENSDSVLNAMMSRRIESCVDR